MSLENALLLYMGYYYRNSKDALVRRLKRRRESDADGGKTLPSSSIDIQILHAKMTRRRQIFVPAHSRNIPDVDVEEEEIGWRACSS